MMILVRHGRTQANAAGLLQGRLDLALDDVGAEQALQVARAIGPVDRVVCSPLLRARQTAAAFDAPCVQDDRWIELSYGSFEGLPMKEVGAQTWDMWRSDSSFAPPEGESLDDVDPRVRLACAELLEQSARERIVVVSHVSPIKAAVAWALAGEIKMSWNCHLEQASVCRIVRGAHGPILQSFNEILYSV